MSEENENNTSPEENQPESTPEDQGADSQPDDAQADAGGDEEITAEEAEMLAMLEGGGGGDEKTEKAGKAEEDMSSNEAATLAAAMAAISQVQGVADSVAPSAPAPDPAPPTTPFESPELESNLSPKAKEGMDLLSDVHMDVRIELGRTKMYVEDVLKLSDGAVVELDKLAGDPVDVFVNSRKVARGEVLVLNDMFCVRISEIVDIAAANA